MTVSFQAWLCSFPQDPLVAGREFLRFFHFQHVASKHFFKSLKLLCLGTCQEWYEQSVSKYQETKGMTDDTNMVTQRAYEERNQNLIKDSLEHDNNNNNSSNNFLYLTLFYRCTIWISGNNSKFTYLGLWSLYRADTQAKPKSWNNLTHESLVSSLCNR